MLLHEGSWGIGEESPTIGRQLHLPCRTMTLYWGLGSQETIAFPGDDPILTCRLISAPTRSETLTCIARMLLNSTVSAQPVTENCSLRIIFVPYAVNV